MYEDGSTDWGLPANPVTAIIWLILQALGFVGE